MIVVKHRVNAISDLNNTAQSLGCEIDLRNHDDEIFVTHDAFDRGNVSLDQWLDSFSNSFLILNVKEEGLESRIFDLMDRHNISDFFILDETIPFIRKHALNGRSEFATRVSEIESEKSAILLQQHLQCTGSKIDWVWVDSFNGSPLQQKVYIDLKKHGFKICQVSPELHHLDKPEYWERLAHNFLDSLQAQNVKIDMICTKLTSFWSMNSEAITD